MNLPVVTDADIDELLRLSPDLDFTDAERRAVLKEAGSKDINAAPGSGKTTVLATKLLLLAKKWTATRSGICVLSHTNVARVEIEHRLGTSVTGSELLGYPHFIGTIHALVNQFLALPLLRSNGLHIDIIDDDVFAKKASFKGRTDAKLRFWMEKDSTVGPMVERLVYKGASLTLASEARALPRKEAPTYERLSNIKSSLTEQGIFRYADMFAFAEHALERTPELRTLLSKRFPLVFIDEMQDTSGEQEQLLNLMFDETVVIQRFGDVNQRILNNGEDFTALTFPKADALPISTSKRFGPRIAQTVASAQLSGVAVVGEGADPHPPMLLTYATGHITSVIERFGQVVLELHSDEHLRKGPVKAMCARKLSEAAKAVPGRAIPDYWPAFSEDLKPGGIRLERFWNLLSGAGAAPTASKVLTEHVSDLRRAILMALRNAKADCVKDIRDGMQLMRQLGIQGVDTKELRKLMRELLLLGPATGTEDGRQTVIARMHESLGPLLPAGMALQHFGALPCFEWQPGFAKVDGQRTICRVEHAGRTVDVQIGTVHSMKGETHLASLVLESFSGQAKKFDFGEILPVVADIQKRGTKLGVNQLGQYRALYVGMSRPTSFLCVAANSSRVSEECKAALTARGWLVEHLG